MALRAVPLREPNSATVWKVTFQHVHWQRQCPLQAVCSRGAGQHQPTSTPRSQHSRAIAFESICRGRPASKTRQGHDVKPGQIKVHQSPHSWSEFLIGPFSRTYYVLSDAGHRLLHR